MNVKKTLAMLAINVLFGSASALAQKGKPHDPNPTKDPHVQRIYDKHQKETKEKREKQKVKGQVDANGIRG